ncbi:hypothetical protein FISHEDRAFT_60688 [Fistulina hepatica ATCC 64428]|uniref:Uncharacterized protein n=1 Tax=Fistulina hepatica ATCC 64428 TaxID=1128425 RepID=A0A0D7A7E9_9AGAR|nr:hypothetical protein FISHEDRAFT_60688 [Fistulina hepatica ATCC 64428]
MAPGTLEPPRTRSTTSSTSGLTTMTTLANNAGTPLASDASHPRVTYVRINDTTFKHNDLSEQHRNWDSWSRQISYILDMSGSAADILDGSLAQPDRDYEPIAHSNWRQMDRAIRALCLKHMSLAEISFVEDGAFPASSQMWDALRARHTKLGPMIQVLDMRSILTMRFSPEPSSLLSYADEIIRRSDTFFKMGMPTADMFRVLFLVSALENPVFTQAKERIICEIQSSTLEKPYTAATFITALRGIKTSLESGQFSEPLLANTARTATVTNVRQCTNVPNCKTPKTHTLPYCTAPGGGMAGKSVSEAQAQRRIDRGLPPLPARESTKAAQSSSSSSKAKKVFRDKTGRAYIVDLDSITAVTEDPDDSSDNPSSLLTTVHSDELSSVLADIDHNVRGSMTDADLLHWFPLS